MAPDGVSVHAARVPFGMKQPDGTILPAVGPEMARAFSEPPEVDHATARLAALSPSAIVYAFTSSSYVCGPSADRNLAERLQEGASGAHVVVQSQAIVRALAALEVDRIALIHPPWFSADLDELGAHYFTAQGIEVVGHSPARLRQEYGDVHPRQLFHWIVREVPSRAHAIVIAGGGFRAIGAIEALEERRGCPVVTANQASFWCALRLSSINDVPSGYGRLFSRPLAT
jgi:maleate isomerase